MSKILLIATLTLCAFAWAQAEDSSSYDQTVAAQAQENSLALAASAQSAAVSAESENWNEPGSIASNSGEDFYAQTVASQAKLNSLIKAANSQSGGQEAMPAEQETSSVAAPESMASNQWSQSEDFYNKIVAEQADRNSSFLDSQALLASAPSAADLSGAEPGSMASNEGAQSAGQDFYDQTIAIQANSNRLSLDANRF